MRDGDEVVLGFADPNGPISSPATALDNRYLWGPAVDQLLADETSGNTVHWMLADHQGSIRDLVNNNGTDSGNHVVFDSFGKVLSGTLGTRFSYTGQEYDADTGLYYYNARWYNPGTGKFMSKDPIGFAAGDTNQYRYVGKGSASFVDPSGLAGTWWDLHSSPFTSLPFAPPSSGSSATPRGGGLTIGDQLLPYLEGIKAFPSAVGNTFCSGEAWDSLQVSLTEQLVMK